MKPLFLTLLILLSGLFLNSQTLTYSNFSNSLTYTLPINVASNSSYNTSLSTTTGSAVTWDASALSLQPGPPTIHLSYFGSSGTPNGSLYPSSNYSEYDPALTSVVDYNYYGINSDSLVDWGTYSPDASHEIFQNPDKRLIFPFSYGQSFTDNYAKTNYSDATTVSSVQTGSRTVTFAGYGTLILPQGSISNIALISEIRTNSLGPNSNYYSWISISDGKRWLYRSENNGSITTAWCADPTTGIKENTKTISMNLFPNPMSAQATLKINSNSIITNSVFKLYNVTGEEVRSTIINNNETIINKDGMKNGIYFYQLINDGKQINSGKLIIQ